MRAFLVAFVVLVVACGTALTSTDTSELAQFKAQQTACIAANPANRSAQDACIRAVQQGWYQKWNGRFDGGFE